MLVMLSLQEAPADASVTVSAAASRNGKLGAGGSKIDLSGSGLSELPPEAYLIILDQLNSPCPSSWILAACGMNT